MSDPNFNKFRSLVFKALANIMDNDLVIPCEVRFINMSDSIFAVRFSIDDFHLQRIILNDEIKLQPIVVEFYVRQMLHELSNAYYK